MLVYILSRYNIECVNFLRTTCTRKVIHCNIIRTNRTLIRKTYKHFTRIVHTHFDL